jgi:hypothetical protein
MDYTIYPYEGVGPIRFGMTSQQVHEILGEPEDNLPAGERCDLPADFYVKKAVFIYYKEPGVCEAIEITKRASLFFNDQELTNHPFRELKKHFQRLDETVKVDDVGLTSYKYGIGLYVPDYCGHDEDVSIEAVIVFERGYYDKS